VDQQIGPTASLVGPSNCASSASSRLNTTKVGCWSRRVLNGLKLDSMPLYHAVRCKTCEATIILGGPIVDKIPGALVIVMPPGEPVPCNECGSSYLYSSDDGFEVEAN
jgi:hypothetical protein